MREFLPHAARAVRVEGGLPRRIRCVRADRDAGYEVCLVEDVARGVAATLHSRIDGRRALVVSTPTVTRLYTHRILERLRETHPTVALHVVECSESRKSLKEVTALCEAASRHELDRRGVLVAVGGGVCWDIVTMAAAWFRRGIDYIRVPTTLIGQVDAGIGIKGAVNFGGKKSFLGTFHPPCAVLIDPAFLPTVSERDMRCGLAEVIKIAVVRNPDLFRALERSAGAFAPVALRDVVWQAASDLLEELEDNLYENRGYERLADFGHTFSPALESASGFSMRHGEAVAVDMALCVEINRARGRIADDAADRILELLEICGLPVYDPLLDSELCERSLREAARHRGGSPNVVLPQGIGEAEFERETAGISPRLLERALARLRSRSTGT